MDENRVEGSVRKVAGKVQEGVGRATGDAKMQVEGMANEIRGSTQDLYGQVKTVPRNWSALPATP
jgi:uncharacterized protein YjbJ (UPF0337 family)